jgi:diguanylate cyclase (GGDEF)-like protein
MLGVTDQRQRVQAVNGDGDAGLSGTERVLVLSTALAGLAAVVHWLFVRSLPSLTAPFHLPWVVLAVAFTATEVFVVHLQFRRESHSISLSELSLVIGLLFCRPEDIVLARLVGAAIALIFHRRQYGAKLLFTLCNFALQVTVSIVAFRAVLGHQMAISPQGWVAAFAATMVSDLVGTAAVTFAMSLQEGELQRSVFRQLLSVQTVATLANTCLALVAAAVLWQDVRAAWLLLVVATIMLFGYRAYTSLSQRYASLELLYGFTRTVGRSLQTDVVMTAMLTQARDLLRAEVAEITLLGGEDAPALRSSVAPDGGLQTVPVHLHVDGSAELRVALADTTLLVPRSSRGDDSKRVLGRDLKDAMIAPLHGDAGVVGTLLVANRIGTVSTFDAEDLKLFETIAAHASVSLENGRLIDRLRDEAAEKEHQSLHDALTGLPNRSLFHRRVQRALETARAGHLVGSLMLFVMEPINEVIAALRHHMGDLLLKEISAVLQEVLDGKGIVARLGGDEFAILLPQVLDRREAQHVAQCILASLERPIVLNDLNLEVGASIGLAMFPHHGDDSPTLLQRADVAMYSAKSRHSGYEVYAAERDEHNPRRLSLAGELRAAIENSELTVHYQPKVDLHTGRITGVEALVRWAHPRHGFLPSDEFIPIAEHTGLIRPLTLHVLKESLEQCRVWEDMGIRIGVAVNLSTRSLMDLDLPDDVARMLAENVVSPELLILEITESTIMADPGRTVGVLSRLSAMGVGLAIDDFGTGYSSLSYLKRLPVDEVKIDKSFVMNMRTDDNDAVIVRSTVDLAKNLGLKVTAEGVEDRETWDRLVALGCDRAQGYYLSRPLPASKLTTLFLEKGLHTHTWLAERSNVTPLHAPEAVADDAVTTTEPAPAAAASPIPLGPVSTAYAGAARFDPAADAPDNQPAPVAAETAEEADAASDESDDESGDATIRHLRVWSKPVAIEHKRLSRRA